MSKTDEPDSTLYGFYSLTKVRDLVAELLDYDSNPKLTEEQEQVRAEYGPVSKPVYERGELVRYVEIFEKPCPPHLRRQLDEVFGRPHRIRIEGSTVDDWLETVAGIKITPGAVYECWKIDKAFARYRAEKAAAAPPTATAGPRGPAPALLLQMVEALLDKIVNHEVTAREVNDMAQERLAEWLGVSRDIAVKARESVVRILDILNTDKTEK
jgi:hypothetical protein